MNKSDDGNELHSPVQASLMSSLSLIQEEILKFLRRRTTVTQDEIIQALKWPSVLITMSIGSLIRNGLIELKGDGGKIVLGEASSG